MEVKMLEKKQQLESYRSDLAISQSDLSLLDYNPFAFHHKVEKIEDYFIIGSATDTLLMLGEDYLFNEMIVLQQTPPTGQLFDFIKYLVEMGGQIPIDKHIAQDAFILVNSKKYKLEWFLEELEKKYLDYFIEVLQAKEKPTITYEQFIKSKTIAQTVLEDKYASKYFNNSNYLYQHPLFSKVNGVRIKGLLDIIEKDDDKKTVRAVDFKTTSKSAYKFISSYLSYRYDLQGSFYYELLKANFKDYEVLETKFIVAETEYVTNPPIVYQMPMSEIDGAKNGRTINGRYYKGWLDLLNEFTIRNKTDNWKYPLEYEKNGCCEIFV